MQDKENGFSICTQAKAYHTLWMFWKWLLHLPEENLFSCWQGSGHGQGSLPRLVHDFTKVTVLGTNFVDYGDVVLVRLPLFWRSASIPKDLSGDSKCAAFQLCEALEKPSEDDEELTIDLP